MTGPSVLDQKSIRLTAHPLQRVGALSVCALGGADGPDDLTPERFDAAVDRMTTDAVRAAFVASTKDDDGFWLKTSGSFFPNSKMNHPSRLGKRDTLREEITGWRAMPAVEAWPAVPCALCGRQAVGFYGKVDIALAASHSHRNTIPRGHEGLALCWPCVCCFHALPYGCVLTGGPSSVLHSFDDEFLRAEVSRQVAVNHRHITLGVPVVKGDLSRDATALRRLRDHTSEIRAGVDLMVFGNDNREAVLTVESLDQPLAEWLRYTQRPSRRQGFRALVRAHVSATEPGLNALARNAFHQPARIIAAAARYASRVAERTGTPPADMTDLEKTCGDFARRVLNVNADDVQQVEALATNLATVISADTVRGPLTGLLRAAKNRGQLQGLLQTMSAKWLLSPPAGAATGPLLTTRQFRLLFDPDSQSWLYRQLLTIAVLQRLSEIGWRPGDAADAVAELDDDQQAYAEIDNRHIDDEDGETE